MGNPETANPTPQETPDEESDDSDASYAPGSSIVVVGENTFDEMVDTVEQIEAAVSGDEEAGPSSQLPGVSAGDTAAPSSRMSEASFESVTSSLLKAQRKRKGSGSWLRGVVNLMKSNSTNTAVVQDVDENVQQLIKERQEAAKAASRGKGRGKGRGRGKGKTGRTFVPPELENSPKVAKILQTFEQKKKKKKDEKKKEPNQKQGGREDPPPPPLTLDYTYVQKIELLRNNSTIDNFVGGANLEHDNNAFQQFLINMNYARSGSEGGGIDYEEFMGGCYVRAWDLTTAGPGHLRNVEPTIVATNYALKIELSKPAPEAIKVLVISEKPSIMTISKEGNTGVSYLG